MNRILKIAALIIGITGAAVLAVILIFPRQAKGPEQVGSLEDVRQYFMQITSDNLPPALSVAVMKDGRLVYSEAFGSADGLAGIEAGTDTLFPWWSVTKLFTAAAVLKLCEQGKIELDSSVGVYLPWFNLTDKNGEPAEATIRQLLEHQSGLKDIIPEGIAWIHPAGAPPVSQTRIVADRLNGDYRRLLFKPGTETKYSNTGYIVLSAVIETVSGISYEDWVMENIIAPLGLNDTVFLRSEAQQLRTASGSMNAAGFFSVMLKIFGPDDFREKYVSGRLDGRIWLKPLYTDYTASTGLSGTAEELAIFGNWLMSGTGPAAVLMPETLIKMRIEPPLQDLPDSSSGDKVFGLGLKVWKHNGMRVYGHSGGGPGYGALLAIIPEQELVIAVNANDTSINRDEIFRVLAAVKW